MQAQTVLEWLIWRRRNRLQPDRHDLDALLVREFTTPVSIGGA